MRRFLVLCALALVLAVSSSPGVAGETAPKVFGKGSWQDLIGSRKGQPLIVHFWSLACAPCLTELPEWGKFLAGHPGAPLVLINWRTRPQPADRISGTLAKAGLAEPRIGRSLTISSKRSASRSTVSGWASCRGRN